MPSDDSMLEQRSENNSHPTSQESEQSPISAGKEETLEPMRGGDLRVVENMDASLEIPTATSYRVIPVKLMEENRRVINEHLEASSRGKVSFTHIISWAIIQAVREFPEINSSYDLIDNSPHLRKKLFINLGIAVDFIRKDGTRTLIVPNLKNADRMSFQDFLHSYDALIERVRKGVIVATDFQDTTLTLTNPGTVGTLSSVPRLMSGQGAVIATGSIGYPAEYHAWASRALSSLGLSKVMTVSCTYDHRIIQGAQSGEFLGRIQELLQCHKPEPDPAPHRAQRAYYGL